MTPYYDDGQVTIYHGDALEVLPALNLAPDVVVTDPPYGETSLEWDRWPKGWPSRVLTAFPTAPLWCFGSLRMFLEQRDEFGGYRLAQDVVWEKQDGSGFTTDRFRRVHEYAVQWYPKSVAWTDLHRDTPKVEGGVPKDVRRAPVRKELHGDRGASRYVSDGTRLMRSVIRVRNCHGYAEHPTQKPVGIVRPLIEYSCPPGGLVIDPFGGSGTTAVAARDAGRRAVLIEGREDYCAVARGRLAQGALDLGGAA